MPELKHIWSVEDITAEIKSTLIDNAILNGFYVRGEITAVTRKPGRRPGSLYLYFTIKDNNIPLPCVMFEGVRELDFDPKPGDKVVCGGRIDVYPPQGKYQMVCTSIEEDGEGEAALALERLRLKLEAEGLFVRKRPFPPYPKKIAVITSPTGAVVHDVIETTNMRYPITEICVIPAVVQGENAVPTLVAGIQKAQTVGADVIIIGRGGGSKEDLDCFNSEILARAIFNSSIPVISAVGHETDTTIADLVADARASTPTQAAEIAVPDVRRILGEIAHYKQFASITMNRKITDLQRDLSILEKDVRLYSPQGRINQWENELAHIGEAMSNNIHRRLSNAENEFRMAVQSVSDLNPLKVLNRGYSLVKCGDKVITSANDVAVGDVIDVTLSSGTITAEVKGIK